MKYKIHHLKVKGNSNKIKDELEEFLNKASGDVLAVVPLVEPTFRPMGATAKVSTLLVVEKLK